jgi:hypothetical protein
MQSLIGRRALALAVASFVAACLPAQQTRDAPGAFFRGAKWGMSKAQIINYEGRRPVLDKTSEGLQTITFEDEALGMKVQVVYSFQDDRLVRAGYAFMEEHGDKSRYIEDYNRVEAAIGAKWGPASNTPVMIWSDGAPPKDERTWGAELGKGRLRYESLRESADTEVLHSLASAGPRIAHGLIYLNKAFERAREQAGPKSAPARP